MIYANLIKKLINYMFGENHPIIVTEFWIQNSKKTKPEVCVLIYSDENYYGKIVGKNGSVINLLTNLLRIKSYLNGCQATLKIEK